ncbi:MAG: hypothetical protein ACOC54_03845 [Candidatus Sumerlaeota bacterium]
MDDWHARIGTAEMLDHQFLSEDCLVEKTAWSSGEEIMVNFSDEPRKIDGKTLKPLEYLIER